MSFSGEASASAPSPAGAGIATASATELRSLYAAGAVSPVEVIEATLDRVALVEPSINAFITLAAEQAMAQAKEAEKMLASGSLAAELPLLGVPVSVKDLTATEGIRTTRGSLISKDWIPSYDAVAVERIKAAGGLILGKTNTCEDGWKGDSGNRLIGPTLNPWDPELTAGGSSGGSAAAVAVGVGPLATGTDGAGSIRIPAAFCGVFGLKPSFGRIPYHPMSPENLSHFGPISRTVSDAALLLDVLSGPDPRDTFSLPRLEGGALQDRTELSAPASIAWSATLGFAQPDAEIVGASERAANLFAGMGHRVVTVEPELRDPCPLIEVLIAAAAAAPYRTGLDEEVRRELDPGRVCWIERGLALSAAELAAAEAERAEFCEAVRCFMEPYDLLLTPTVPVKPFPAGWDSPTEPESRSTDALCWTSYTYPMNLTGYPAASVPVGFTESGLPVGVQLVGRWRDDVTVLRAALALERAAPWVDHYPDLWARHCGSAQERSRV